MEAGKARVPPPPRPKNSLLGNALGGGSSGSAPGGGNRGSAMVSGVRGKLAASSDLLNEAVALSSSTQPRPVAQWRDTPANTAIPCGDPRIGGAWRPCCTLPCCSTLSSAIKRNAHGSPAQSDDEEPDDTPQAWTAHTNKTARAGTLDFLHNTSQGQDLARAMGRGAAELAHELQADAAQLSFRENHELAKIAQDNHTLIKRGSFEVGRQGFRLDTNGLPNRTHRLSAPVGGRPLVPAAGETALCVANIDTASCLRALIARGANPCALNFANAFHAGGGYLRGARAQEEDLCRLMPPLFGQLKRLRYPLGENETHYTHTLLARQAGTYQLLAPPLRVAIVSGAMPNLGSAKGARRGERQLQPGTEQWRRTVELRCRVVVDAAVANGHDAIILGAFGCGAFGNPPADVAAVFARVLHSAEFRGKLQLVVFAIVDPKAADAGNLVTFRDVLKRELCEE